MNKALVDLLERVRSWPEAAQGELEQLARDIELELAGGNYRATQSELMGIDRGLRDAADGEFATEQEIETTFAKYRRP
jgi:predicted transcriptional regulator